jgi:two-component system sensor histidine kinase AgrC
MRIFNKQNHLLIVSTILFQTLLIAIINIRILITDDIAIMKGFLPFANAVLLVSSIFVIWSIRQVGESRKKEIESHLLYEHLKNVEDLVKSLHTQHHEHTRHIQTIQAMLYLNEHDTAREYLDGIAEKYWSIEDLIYTQNPALTALLNVKRKVAEINNVAFDFSIKTDISRLKIESWDLCSIVGNLIDNALEAAVNDEQQPRVGIEIKKEDNNCLIYVYNNGTKISSHEIPKIFRPGYSRTSFSTRGFGLYLVKKLVEEYSGSINVITEPRTTFIVSLPLEENTQGGLYGRLVKKGG